MAEHSEMNPEVFDEKLNSKLIKVDDRIKWKETMFLASVTGVSAFVAFGSTLAMAKRKDPKMFSKGLFASSELPESGAALAMRALKYGTIYAVTGCGLLFYGVWKLSGAENLHDFRMRMGAALPRITKEGAQGRTEFENFTDFMNYVTKKSDDKDK
ncbi:transmembrane protein 242 [Nilaparvata lugens]|uniref:transmembrane protein 242 n=1 Tax=Nilaparvata lugens TaxID=108931 RepID=UPI000B983E39|nr:transmembrane protein 242 [Nilaparvata lugens]